MDVATRARSAFVQLCHALVNWATVRTIPQITGGVWLGQVVFFGAMRFLGAAHFDLNVEAVN